ncbi:hypothetical protein AgCh_000204 [Apium graveolens]
MMSSGSVAAISHQSSTNEAVRVDLFDLSSDPSAPPRTVDSRTCSKVWVVNPEHAIITVRTPNHQIQLRIRT